MVALAVAATVTGYGPGSGWLQGRDTDTAATQDVADVALINGPTSDQQDRAAQYIFGGGPGNTQAERPATKPRPKKAEATEKRNRPADTNPGHRGGKDRKPRSPKDPDRNAGPLSRVVDPLVQEAVKTFEVLSDGQGTPVSKPVAKTARRVTKTGDDLLAEVVPPRKSAAGPTGLPRHLR